MAIRENLTLSSLKQFTKFVHLSLKQEAEHAREFIRRLTIKVASPENPVSSLSGGNQQKVVIGKALMTQPKVLLMDEPSRGIDVGAKAEIYKTMRELAAEGIGIVFVTSDLEEVLALSDRILVMADGRVAGEFGKGRQGGRCDCRGHAGQEQGPSSMTTASVSDGHKRAEPQLVAAVFSRRGTFVALILVLGYFSFAAPNFLTPDNAVLVTKHVAINAFLAIGMTFVIITGGIDLSVGSVVGPHRHGRRLALDLWHQSGARLVDPVQHVRNHPAGLPARHRRGGGQRLPDNQGKRGAIYRNARHALCRARRGAFVLERAHIPEP